MKVFLAGSWVDKSNKIEVRNPFDNSIIDTVPKADSGDVETALAFAERGAKVMAKLSSYDRWKILRKAADLMAARNEELGQTISKEEGKIIAEGRGEASRAVETMMGSAEEAKRLHGETVPLDADPTGGKKLGFTLRVPCGVVAAIAPFNFPLNLVCHKVGPALAAGNAVVVKPATDTPLSALRLTEILLEAGLPPEGINTLTGSGRDRLCQRRPGVHLHPAGPRGRQGLRRPPGRAEAQGGGPEDRQPVRRDGEGGADGARARGGAGGRVGEGGGGRGGAPGD